MHRHLRPAIAAVSLVLLIGCGLDDPDPETSTNIGEACLLETGQSTFPPPSEEVTVESGADLQIEVIFNSCGSACAEVLESSCEVNVDGETVQVESSITVQPSDGGPCPASCAIWTAQCDVGTLPDGEYTVEYGDASTTAKIPGEVSCATASTP